MFVLKKKKGNKIELYRTKGPITETFNLVEVDPNWLDRIGVNAQISYTFEKSHPKYLKLDEYIKKACAFLNRAEIPNKKIQTDRDGTSKLMRYPEKGYIEISYRVKKKDGSLDCTSSTPNKCFIDNETREKFFRDVKYCGSIYNVFGHDSYRIVESSDPLEYGRWSDYMDEEYKRLSGIDPNPGRKETVFPPYIQKDKAEDVQNIVDSVEILYEHTKLDDLLDLMEHSKFIKVSKDRSAIYDRDGKLVAISPINCKDAFKKILVKLDWNEVKSVLHWVVHFARELV